MQLDLEAHLADAQQAAAAASTEADVRALSAEYLGKKSQLKAAKKQLGALDPDERRSAGLRLNDAIERLETLFEHRGSQLADAARRSQLEAERLDLTELLHPIERGHLHLVTQARDRLEDVFVGMGYEVAEGPEVETAWYNFEALNIPEWHPARGSFDTIFVDLGEPESVMLRSHTSPVQIRTMEVQEPPIYIVAPGRTFRTDTADATHLPAFNQIEGLVVDRGITLGDLAGTIDDVRARLLRRRSQDVGSGPATSPSPSRRPSSTSPAPTVRGSNWGAVEWCTPTCCATAASTPINGRASPSVSASIAWP